MEQRQGREYERRRRCAEVGCERLTRAKGGLCQGHSRAAGAVVEEKARPEPKPKSRGSGGGKGNIYERLLTEEEQLWLEEVMGSGQAGIEQELAAARLVLARLLAREGKEMDASRAALNVAKLEQIRRQLSGKRAEGLVAAVDAVLRELG